MEGLLCTWARIRLNWGLLERAVISAEICMTGCCCWNCCCWGCENCCCCCCWGCENCCWGCENCCCCWGCENCCWGCENCCWGCCGWVNCCCGCDGCCCGWENCCCCWGLLTCGPYPMFKLLPGTLKPGLFGGFCSPPPPYAPPPSPPIICCCNIWLYIASCLISFSMFCGIPVSNYSTALLMSQNAALRARSDSLAS